MKTLKLTILLGLFTLALSMAAIAGDKKDNKAAEKKPATEQSAPEAEHAKPVALKNQTHCPVMGGEIDSSAYTDIQGQRVYHCCPMCSKKLKADPDKYFKKAAADGILFENIQTKCPVSGEALDENAKFFDYEGRRVYVCCEKCQSEFMKDPKAYLDKMTGQVEADKKADAKETGAKMNHEMKHGSSGHDSDGAHKDHDHH